MRISVAEYAGFCFGVERAMRMLNDAAGRYQNVFTYGPLIHNPQVVEDLANSGVGVKNEISEISAGMTAVVRTHGVPIGVLDDLESIADNVIDATCPFVKKVQNAANSFSKKCSAIVVVGEINHPEVQGIVSYIEEEYFVIASIEEAEALGYKESYGVVAQTTQNEAVYNDILKVLRTKCDRLEVAHTICSATQNRQKAALALAKDVDVMLIVGGKNSANTSRLFQLCKEVCPRVFHIETEQDLTPDMYLMANHIGISAGASTPTKLVNNVREYILERTK